MNYTTVHYCPRSHSPLPTHSLIPLRFPHKSAHTATRVTRGEGGTRGEGQHVVKGQHAAAGMAKEGHVARGRRDRATRQRRRGKGRATEATW